MNRKGVRPMNVDSIKLVKKYAAVFIALVMFFAAAIWAGYHTCELLQTGQPENAENRVQSVEDEKVYVKAPVEVSLPPADILIVVEDNPDAMAEKEDQQWDEMTELERIDAALLENGYFREDVPLSFELQDYLHTACEESGVPYALALAVIQKETCFQNLVGDSGAAEGYMQVHRRDHYDRMRRLGVSDLMDPFGNFRVGCDFLAELLRNYPTQEALTAYNSGSPGYNEYSYVVMGYYEEWKKLVGDDVSGIKS